MDAPLATYGWDDRWSSVFAAAAAPGDEPGRIVRYDRAQPLVVTRHGVERRRARRAVGPLTVGDWVVVDGEGVVVGLLDRTSLLRRRNPDDGEQLLAANVDVVAMVFGSDRPLRAGRLHRTRTQIWDSGATPLVIVTKTDLLDSPGERLEQVREIDPLLEVIAVSSVNGDGLESLRNRVVGRTLVLIGESGAGKSTLVNALVGDDVATVADVRAGDRRGRHTTTAREVHPLVGGGVLIDTPGIREVGLWTDEAAVDATFPEIEVLGADCRFRDCSHGPEPGCAVRAAVEDGRLSRGRYDAWESLRREAASAALRADEQARRAADRRFGRDVEQMLRDKGHR